MTAEYKDDRFRQLFEHSSDAHIILGPHGIVDCNQATINILRCKSKDDVLSIHPASLSPEYQPDGRLSSEKSKEMDSIAFKNGFHRFEWVHQACDGTLFPVDVTLNPIHLDEGPGIVAVWHDLRERKKIIHDLEEMQKELQVKNIALEQKNKLLTEEMAAAAAVQKSLLPESTPLCKKIQFTWEFIPSTHLAGDILNVFRIDDKHIGMYILDVSGHGVAASLFSVAASHFLSPFSSESFIQSRVNPGLSTPCEVAGRLNSHFSKEIYSQMFFTMVYAIINTETLELMYTCAGHPEPVHVTSGNKWQFLKGTDPPIGIIENWQYSGNKLQLSKGDKVLFYTDGVFETADTQNECYGVERLGERFAQDYHLNIRDSVDNIILNITNWHGPSSFEDDVSILAFSMNTDF